MIATLRLRGFVPALFIAAVLAAAFLAPLRVTHAGIRTVTSPYCSGAAISAAPASPQLTGTPIVFTGSASFCSTTPLYQFFMRAASQPDWVMIQAYSASASYNWNSTGAAPGTVWFAVYVKDNTSTTSTFDTYASMAFTVNSLCPGPTSISANPTSVPAGVHSTFTGSTTCVHPNPLYAFWLRTATSDWILARPYSTTPTYDWNSTGAPLGTIYFGLWVKDAQSPTSTFDDNASTTVTVTNPCPTPPTLNAAPSTVVHGVGTHVIVTASATCTNPSPKFQFWLRTTTTDWQLVQTYSTTATYDWNSTGAPVTTVYIGVWVKDASSTTTSFDNNNSVPIPVT